MSQVEEASAPAAPDYSGGSTLTYLNGQTGGYTTGSGSFSNSVSLTAGSTNGATGTYNWDLAQSGSAGTYASLPSCSSCSTNTITSLHESDGCLVYNVQVTTDYGGFHSEPMYLFIDRPSYLAKPLNPDTTTNYGTQGYESNIFYVAYGLCAIQGVLKGYTLNEQFDSSGQTDWVTNNWPHNAYGVTLSPGSYGWEDDVAIAAGNTCGASGTLTCNPVPQNAGSSGSEVQSVPQAWRIGTTSVGSGIVVQRNSLDRYTDHGLHSSIVSPSN